MIRTHRTSPQRIVSLAPSATSILTALGAKQQLVGVTKWCRDVAEVDGLPRLGDCWSLDADRVARLRPTLVIGSMPYKQETVTKLLELPLSFLALSPRTLADVEADIRLLGRITGRRAAAEELVNKMRASFADVTVRARRAKSRPRVYCEAWPKPRISSPPWVGELVEIAGGEMVLPTGTRVTEEDVARASPEVIVIAWAATGARPDSKSSLAIPAWKEVPAVRRGRVHVVRDELLNTPGPPLMEGARELFGIIHPELARRRGPQDRRS